MDRLKAWSLYYQQIMKKCIFCWWLSTIIVDRYGELENQTLLKEMASWTAGAKVRIPLLNTWSFNSWLYTVRDWFFVCSEPVLRLFSQIEIFCNYVSYMQLRSVISTLLFKYYSALYPAFRITHLIDTCDTWSGPDLTCRPFSNFSSLGFSCPFWTGSGFELN
jgi:hypothetical protein